MGGQRIRPGPVHSSRDPPPSPYRAPCSRLSAARPPYKASGICQYRGSFPAGFHQDSWAGPGPHGPDLAPGGLCPAGGEWIPYCLFPSTSVRIPWEGEACMAMYGSQRVSAVFPPTKPRKSLGSRPPNTLFRPRGPQRSRRGESLIPSFRPSRPAWWWAQRSRPEPSGRRR